MDSRVGAFCFCAVFIKEGSHHRGHHCALELCAGRVGALSFGRRAQALLCMPTSSAQHATAWRTGTWVLMNRGHARLPYSVATGGFQSAM